jgi:transcriptional regulator with XRE-family HTH domain
MSRSFAPAHREGDPRVAAVLRARRRGLGLSTERAAKRAGCSTGMWSMLENCKRVPSVVMAEAIADALHLTGDDRALVLGAGLEGVGLDSSFKRGAALRRR